jgi:hypothetical protein
MIWLLWHIFIVVESKIHEVFISVGFDPTPDDKFITWSKLCVVSLRFVVYLVLVIVYQPELVQYVVFTLGALFTHLLLFPILLNKWRGLQLHYLGNGFTDKILKLSPSFVFRVWCLLVLSASAIYTYYNTDLL